MESCHQPRGLSAPIRFVLAPAARRASADLSEGPPTTQLGRGQLADPTADGSAASFVRNPPVAGVKLRKRLSASAGKSDGRGLGLYNRGPGPEVCQFVRGDTCACAMRHCVWE